MASPGCTGCWVCQGRAWESHRELELTGKSQGALARRAHQHCGEDYMPWHGHGLAGQALACCSTADHAHILFHPLHPVTRCVMTHLEGVSVQAAINLGSAKDLVPRA